MIDRVLARIDEDLGASLERLFALLRIESISTDPAYADSCGAAAAWLADALSELGFDAAVRETRGHPMVVGHDGTATERPHVLFYGHYDVQPVDPVGLWHTPPFDPRIEAGDGGAKRIVGRGASDDKGQLMTFIEACRAWKQVTGALPVQVSVLLEGEEESGSPSLGGFLDEHAAELRADIALVCDTAMWSRQRPAITVMLRGLVGEEVVIGAADRDLHSGLFGGPARNPIQVLAGVLAGLHEPDGRVSLPGFYDGVGELPADVRAQWDELDFDAAGFLGAVGLEEAAGETERSVLEKLWSRPTCEINGIVGGYTGEGFKTVIPANASAKVSFRLTGDQDPERIRESFRSYVRDRLPDDCHATFTPHGGSPALRLPLDGAYLAPARSALAVEWGVEPALVGSGGSIPVVGEFKRRLGMDALMVGFALDDDRIHSPNEKYDLRSFHGGIRSWARILAALAQ